MAGRLVIVLRHVDRPGEDGLAGAARWGRAPGAVGAGGISFGGFRVKIYARCRRHAPAASLTRAGVSDGSKRPRSAPPVVGTSQTSRRLWVKVRPPLLSDHW